jgi:hypothetical protein
MNRSRLHDRVLSCIPTPAVQGNFPGVEALLRLPENDGAKQDRTADVYNPIVALSRLSYGPGP